MATPSHVDLSVLWVPIMPETSGMGPAMEKAGQDATESFGKGSDKLGDRITDSVSKSKDKIKDVFKRTGGEAADAMAESVNQNSTKIEEAVEQTGKKATGKFRESAKGWGKVLVDSVGPEVKTMLGDRLEDVVGGALDGALGENSKWAGKMARTLGEGAFDAIKHRLGEVKDAANDTKQAFANFKSGDVQGGVSSLVESFGKLGVEAKDIPGPIGEAATKLGEAKTMASDFADIFKDLPGKIGAVGTAIEGLAGPLAVALQARNDIDNRMRQDGINPDAKGDDAKKQFEEGFGRIHRDSKGNIVVDPKPPAAHVDMGGVGGIGKGGDVLGSSSDAYDFFSSGKSLPDAAPSMGTTPSAPAPAAIPIPSSFVSGSAGSVSTPSALRRTAGNVANLFAVAQSLQGTPYSQALRNDCSGMVSKLATAALGMSPSVQFSTVNEGDWLFSHGFQPGLGGPNDLNIGWYDHGGGNNGHTAATLPGGVNAESGGAHGAFLLGRGAAGASDPQFSQHAHLALGGKDSPIGSKDDPLYTTAVHADGSTTSDTQGLAQQFGSGLLGGVAQSVGLDGSVFQGFGGASNPMDFGITKLGTSLLNFGMGLAQQGASMPGMAIPVGASGAQTVNTGDTHIYNAPINTGMSVTQNGVQSPTPDLKFASGATADRAPAMGTVANAGNMP